MSAVGDGLAAAVKNPRTVLRAVASLAAAIATALLASGALDPVPKWLALVPIVASGVVVWAGAGDGQQLVNKP